VAVSRPIGSGFILGFSPPGGDGTRFFYIKSPPGGEWVGVAQENGPPGCGGGLPFKPPHGAYAACFLRTVRATPRSLAVETISAPVRDMSEFESVVVAQARAPDAGFIVMPDAFADVQRAEMTSLAARYGVPVVYPRRNFTEVGGLLSYGIDMTDNFRRSATYSHR